MAILTFVMFTAWMLVKSFIERPPGDYETEVCDIRLKDKKYDEAIEAAKMQQNRHYEVAEEKKSHNKRKNKLGQIEQSGVCPIWIRTSPSIIHAINKSNNEFSYQPMKNK